MAVHDGTATIDAIREEARAQGRAEILALVAKLPNPWKREAWGFTEHVEVRHRCDWCDARHDIAISEEEWDKANYPDNVAHLDNGCLWVRAQKS